MCLAIPLQIIELNGNDAIAEANGIRRSVRVDFINEPKVGDFIISHAGFAIERLDPVQAKENLRAIQEISDVI